MNEKAEPTHLYHYTTAAGFKDIVESQELWMSDIFYLNDWKEFYHGRNEFKKLADETLASFEDARMKTAAQVISLVLEQPRSQMRRHPCVCSFSTAKEGNDLSQWRAYCPDGGYSLGFPHKRLAALADSRQCVLEECRYTIAECVDDLDDLLKALVVGMDRLDKEAFIGGAQMAVSWSIARYKDRAFEDEHEWRLINSHGVEEWRFRCRGNSLIPYAAFSLDDKDLWEGVSVIVGPSSRETDELRVESVKMFLQSELTEKGLPTTCVNNVKASGIPYRTGMGG
jgi:hypothetical protein